MTWDAPPASFAQRVGDALGTIEILDIGAMAEGPEHYRQLLDQGVVRVTGFEPNLAEHAKLATGAGPRRYLPFCLGDGRPATLHITHYPGNSSLLEPDAAVIDAFSGMSTNQDPPGIFKVVERRAVQTVRLDDVADLPPPDLLKIDVQGAELLVLQHATRVLRTVSVLQCEVEFVPLYRGQPLFQDVATFLAGQGFALHKLIDLGGRCYRPFTFENPREPLSQLMWADAVFVRDPFGGPWAQADEVRAAVILSDVYRSHDLAHLLLQRHDRARGTSLAAAMREHARGAQDPTRLFANLRLDS